MLVVRGFAAQAIGLSLVLAGIILNEWVLAAILSSDGHLRAAPRLAIWLFDLAAVAIGLYIFRRSVVDFSVPLLIVLGVVLSVPVIEGSLAIAKRMDPAHLPEAVLNLVRPVVWAESLSMEYHRDCIEYSSLLTYRLKPGKCTFSGEEFNTELFINSRGLRDDEASLAAPEIVTLGDSHTMGWGVEQDQTFASLLEKRLGKRVLNAGVASYGTAREMKLLGTLDRSRLRVLVLQYCANDYPENLKFVETNGNLPVKTASEYAKVVEVHRSKQAYYFGKYTWIAIESAVPLLSTLPKVWQTNPAQGERPVPSSTHQEAEMMLTTLLGSNIDLTGLHVIVLEVNALKTDPQFVSALKPLIDAKGLTNFHIVDVSKILEPADHLPLDGHMNANGHRKVADAIANIIAQLN